MEVYFACQTAKRIVILPAKACAELILIIEVDGITHHSEEALKKDDIREKALESAGFTVLRFDDGQILNSITNVQAFLSDWIDQEIKQQ